MSYYYNVTYCNDIAYNFALCRYYAVYSSIWPSRMSIYRTHMFEFPSSELAVSNGAHFFQLINYFIKPMKRLTVSNEFSVHQ